MKNLKSILIALTVGLLVVVNTQQVFAAKDSLSPVKKHAKDPTLVLPIGKAEIYEIDGRVADVLVADPSIADVVAIQANQLYIVGSELGDTNIITLDEDGNVV